MKTDEKIFSLSGNFTARYVLVDPVSTHAPAPKNIFLLLHGFSQTGEVFYQKVKETLPPESVVLSVNGPFPVPSISPKDGSFRTGFSWYFYERESDSYYVDMDLGLKYVTTLIDSLGFKEMPKKIIGYSQGGYIAPFVALKLKNVEQVVGINCQFLDEELSALLPRKSLKDNPQFDLINGSDDDTVDPTNARQSFEKLQKLGVQGQKILVQGAGHGISADILKALKLVIKTT